MDVRQHTQLRQGRDPDPDTHTRNFWISQYPSRSRDFAYLIPSKNLTLIYKIFNSVMFPIKTAGAALSSFSPTTYKKVEACWQYIAS